MDPSRSKDRIEVDGLGSDKPASIPPIAGPVPPQATSEARPVPSGWETALASALHDVPVPAGLSARLLANISAAETAAEPAAHLRPFTRRRYWLKGVAVGLACAASIAAAVVLLNHPTPALSGESVMELVRAWHKHQPVMLEKLNHDAPPRDYLPGGYLVPGCIVGWSRLSAPLLGRDGIAYELVGPQKNRATLYVLDLDGPRTAPRVWLNTSSPLENHLTTAGQTSAAWTDGSRLYVLVADGDEHDFRALVRAPRSMA